jgi:hypothetical protein
MTILLFMDFEVAYNVPINRKEIGIEPWLCPERDSHIVSIYFKEKFDESKPVLFIGPGNHGDI